MSGFKLLLVDGHSLAFRAFHAFPVDSFLVGDQHTNAIYGFTQMLVDLIDSEKPSHIAVAFDLSRHSFRTDIYPEYKGKRAETPPEFLGQVELIQEMLSAMGIKYLTMENMEADDIVATLAKQGEEKGQVVVYSGDRDYIQMVNDRVTLVYPKKGKVRKRFNPETVVEEYGLPPQQYPEIAALVGETADNLPGVPMWGQKTATKWLQKYGDLENLLAHAKDIPGKAGKNLSDNVELVKRNRALNRLRTDLRLACTIADLQWRAPKKAEVEALCDRLAFRGIRNRILAVRGAGAAESTENYGPDDSYGIYPDAVDLNKFLASKEATSLQLIGQLTPAEADFHTLVMGREEVVVIPVERLSPADERLIGEWLSSADHRKIVYDAKAISHGLHSRGWRLAGVEQDIDILAYLASPDARRSLPKLVEEQLGYQIEDAVKDAQKKEQEAVKKRGKQMSLLEMVDAEDPANAAEKSYRLAIYRLTAMQARFLLELADIYRQQAEIRSVPEKLEQLETDVQKVLFEMESLGIAVDEAYLRSLERDFNSEVQRAESSAYKAIGREVNLASPKQLQDVLFNQLNMPPTRKTKSGYSTDAESLTELAISNPHPFLDALLLHRDRVKLQQITATLLSKIAPDGRIHTTFGQTVAATGRLSSSEPNLQNIPGRTADGMNIRGAFVPSSDYEALLTADYSQIEMRIMAHLSQDEALIEAFRSGEDLHVSVASLVFGIPIEEVTSQQRSHVKATSYGLAYGLSAFGLSKQLGITQKDAEKLMDSYFSRFGKVHDYLERVVAEARSTGFTETMFGRRRFFPDLRSKIPGLAAAAKRAALNAPIQGSAADIIKIAMVAVDRKLREEKLRSRLLLQVHDELVFEVFPGESADLQELVRDAMENSVQLDVPLEVSMGMGESWKDAAH